jgi:hypothetical protein
LSFVVAGTSRKNGTFRMDFCFPDFRFKSGW